MDIAEKLKELNKAQEEKNTEIEILTDTSKRINKLRESLKILESKYVAAKENLEELVDSVDEETDLDSIQEGLINEERNKALNLLIKVSLKSLKDLKKTHKKNKK